MGEAYREYELIHARWAMLGVAGAVFQNSVVGDNWSTTGLKVLNGETISYVAPPFAKFDVPLPLFALLGIQIPLMYFVEKYRTEGTGPEGWAPKVGKFTSASFAGLDSINPGGPWDLGCPASLGMVWDLPSWELMCAVALERPCHF